MIRVTNHARWNRTKGWVAFACWLTALFSVGLNDQTTGDKPNFGVAIIALACCGLLCINIARRR